MNLSRLSHAALAAALLAVAAPMAVAQQKAAPSLASALKGTSWSVVSTELVDPKGQKRQIVEGKNVGGQLMLGADGRFSYQLVSEMPRLAKDRIATTPAEDRMVSQGSLSSYGTYTVDDKEGTLTLKIDRSSYPNQNGQASKRKVTLKGSEMTLENPARMAGGTTRVVLKKL